MRVTCGRRLDGRLLPDSLPRGGHHVYANHVLVLTSAPNRVKYYSGGCQTLSSGISLLEIMSRHSNQFNGAHRAQNEIDWKLSQILPRVLRPCTLPVPPHTTPIIITSAICLVVSYTRNYLDSNYSLYGTTPHMHA